MGVERATVLLQILGKLSFEHLATLSNMKKSATSKQN